MDQVLEKDSGGVAKFCPADAAFFFVKNSIKYIQNGTLRYIFFYGHSTWH
jgi:hypothetical protein